MKKHFILFVIFLAVIMNAYAQKETSGFRLPKYEKVVLPNGLTVYLMEQREVPLIQFSASFPAGSRFDGAEYGLAYMTAEAILFGTESHSKGYIEETMDFYGVRYNSSVNKETADFTASFGTKDADLLLPVIAEILMKPVFPNEEFVKRQQRAVVELKQMRQSPRQVVRGYFDNALYGAHQYANPNTGTSATIGALTVDRLKAFYKERYCAEGSVIALVGDFSAPEMKEKIAKLFGSWKTNPPSKVQLVEVPNTVSKGPRVVLVNKDDATETTFMIGGFGITRNNPDYIGVTVVNTILGARFTSWLNDELRVNAGYTYGARSAFSTYKEAGSFAISTYTRNATTFPAIDLALKTYNRLFEKGIDETTLQSAKNYIKGQFPPDYETNESLADLLTKMYVYDFNESFINTFEEKVDGLTIESTRGIIKKYFPKENLLFVLIGKASELEETAKKYGTIIKKEINQDTY